jgi:EpsI family protein
MNAIKSPIFISLTLGFLMVLSGVLTKYMTPSVQSDPQMDIINLEVMIPLEFDQWKIDHSTALPMINPDVQGLLKKIYNQTLSRTYINSAGERVMLSIAYGIDQSSDLHVHRPEICYASSGFNISKITKTFVDTTIGQIPVMRLVAKQGTRNEPVTYWIRIGDSLTRGWIEQKLTTIGYSLTGKVPDGLLFRISTISQDEQDSYRIQKAFLSGLMQAVRREDRHWLIGQLTQ